MSWKLSPEQIAMYVTRGEDDAVLLYPKEGRIAVHIMMGTARNIVAWLYGDCTEHWKIPHPPQRISCHQCLEALRKEVSEVG